MLRAVRPRCTSMCIGVRVCALFEANEARCVCCSVWQCVEVCCRGQDQCRVCVHVCGAQHRSI